jgi:hypothetical protein
MGIELNRVLYTVKKFDSQKQFKSFKLASVLLYILKTGGFVMKTLIAFIMVLSFGFGAQAQLDDDSLKARSVVMLDDLDNNTNIDLKIKKLIVLNVLESVSKSSISDKELIERIEFKVAELKESYSKTEEKEVNASLTKLELLKK